MREGKTRVYIGEIKDYIYDSWFTSYDDFDRNMSYLNGFIGQIISKHRAEETHEIILHRTPFKPKQMPTEDEFDELEEQFWKNGGGTDHRPEDCEENMSRMLIFCEVVFCYFWGGWHGLEFEWVDAQPNESTTYEPYEETIAEAKQLKGKTE